MYVLSQNPELCYRHYCSHLIHYRALEPLAQWRPLVMVIKMNSSVPIILKGILWIMWLILSWSDILSIPAYLDPCYYGPCNHGGICEPVLSGTVSFECICPPEYSGPTCEASGKHSYLIPVSLILIASMLSLISSYICMCMCIWKSMEVIWLQLKHWLISSSEATGRVLLLKVHAFLLCNYR